MSSWHSPAQCRRVHAPPPSPSTPVTGATSPLPGKGPGGRCTRDRLADHAGSPPSLPSAPGIATSLPLPTGAVCRTGHNQLPGRGSWGGAVTTYPERPGTQAPHPPWIPWVFCTFFRQGFPSHALPLSHPGPCIHSLSTKFSEVREDGSNVREYRLSERNHPLANSPSRLGFP